MYALQSILKKYLNTKIQTVFENDSFVRGLKYYLSSELYKLDPDNYRLLKSTINVKHDEDGRFKISVKPYNLYSLVYFSTGERPNILLLANKHKEMNQEPIVYGYWTFYFNKEEPIAINKNLGKSDKSITKFNL